jgi:deoxyribose-phosphate aldolase
MSVPARHRIVEIIVEELRSGAARSSLHRSGIRTGEVATLIDHTLLRPEATRRDIESLCREAVEHGFATVCVNPTWVAACAGLVEGSTVAVCSVAGFPLGATTEDTKRYEAQRAIQDGAREIDMVMDIGALKSGDLELVGRDIRGVVAECHRAGARTKVIIEAALLTDEEKVTACVLSKAAGADFVKTSTGFGPGGATVADVALMRRVVGETMGIKAAGGVRTLKEALAMLAAGATRIGTSAGVRIVGELAQRASSAERPSTGGPR